MHSGCDILTASNNNTGNHSKGGGHMTDGEKLDLILEKVSTLDEKVTGLEKDVNAIKRQVMKSTAELKAMDEMIFDEVERVHSILNKHKEDKTVHSA